MAERLRWQLVPVVGLVLLAAACTGGGLNSDGTQATATQSALGPVIFAVAIANPPSPLPATCGVPHLPTALSSGGQNLTVTGENFSAAPIVRVGKLLATVTNASATSISATTPTGSPGLADVVVVNADGQLAARPGAIVLCADAASTAASVQVVAQPSRVQIQDEVRVEIQVTPGTQDDLRDLRPALAVDPSLVSIPATASSLSGPSPAGADLLVGGAPTVFRYVFVADTEGDLDFKALVDGFNQQIGSPVNLGPTFLAQPVRVEPLLIEVDLDRTSATVGQILRLRVRVANAGSETVSLLNAEGADPDGDAGPMPPDPTPTLVGGALLTLTLAPNPDQSLGPNKILDLDFIYTATVAGTVSFQANAAGQAPTLGTVRGLTKTTPVVTISDTVP